MRNCIGWRRSAAAATSASGFRRSRNWSFAPWSTRTGAGIAPLAHQHRRVVRPPGRLVAAEVGGELLAPPVRPGRVGDRRDRRERAVGLGPGHRDGQRAVAAHRMPGDPLPLPVERQLAEDELRQLVDDVVPHAEVRRPGRLGGVDVEPRPLPEVVGRRRRRPPRRAARCRGRSPRSPPPPPSPGRRPWSSRSRACRSAPTGTRAPAPCPPSPAAAGRPRRSSRSRRRPRRGCRPPARPPKAAFSDTVFISSHRFRRHRSPRRSKRQLVPKFEATAMPPSRPAGADSFPACIYVSRPIAVVRSPSRTRRAGLESGLRDPAPASPRSEPSRLLDFSAVGRFADADARPRPSFSHRRAFRTDAAFTLTLP